MQIKIRLIFVFLFFICRAIAAPASDERIGWAVVIIDNLTPDGSCNASVIHFEHNKGCTLDVAAPLWKLSIAPFRGTRKISSQGQAFVELIPNIASKSQEHSVRYQYSATSTEGTLPEFVAARLKAGPIVREKSS